MKTLKLIVLLAGLVFALPAYAQTQKTSATPRITDLFSAEETRKSGLSKLTADEQTALNGALFRIFRVFAERVETQASVPPTATSMDSKDVEFFDSRGRAVAYIAADRDLTFYLWTGEPVAYLDEDSLFGFNGKHLGWFKGGAIYDHDGSIVAAAADRFRTPVQTPPPKAFKQFSPFKSFKEFKPFKPFFSLGWSETPARIFFLGGVN